LLPLGQWTGELADRLKAQLEIIWQENGLEAAARRERAQERRSCDRLRFLYI
jgi:hypothetical protein